jgi:hypothetical protein
MKTFKYNERKETIDDFVYGIVVAFVVSAVGLSIVCVICNFL